MRPLRILATLLLACAAGPAHVAPGGRADARPNVILIRADDLGFETLGSYGGESYRTPHLDQMAEKGMRFEHCYSTPLCTPSRVQIMTGQYNFRNYVGFGMLRPGETTFGHLLQKAGYRVGITGKWQLYGNPGQRELFSPAVGTPPSEAGFDEYSLWQVDEGPWEARYKNPRITSTGREPEVFAGAYGPDRYTNFALDFIERHRDRPYFPDARYVHDTAWKLHEDGRIYNIQSDPLERKPLTEADLPPEARERIRSFRAVLESKKDTSS